LDLTYFVMERAPSGGGSGIVGATAGGAGVGPGGAAYRPGRARPGEHRVSTVAVLPGGRVVTGGGYDDRVRLRNVQSSSPGTLLACSAYGLATPLWPRRPAVDEGAGAAGLHGL